MTDTYKPDDEPKLTFTNAELSNYTVTGRLSFSPIPIGNLTIYEGSYSDGINHVYQPQEDITPYELALLMRLFITATSTKWDGVHVYDYWGFVKEHKLERHFTEN